MLPLRYLLTNRFVLPRTEFVRPVQSKGGVLGPSWTLYNSQISIF